MWFGSVFRTLYIENTIYDFCFCLLLYVLVNELYQLLIWLTNSSKILTDQFTVSFRFEFFQHFRLYRAHNRIDCKTFKHPLFWAYKKYDLHHCDFKRFGYENDSAWSYYYLHFPFRTFICGLPLVYDNVILTNLLNYLCWIWLGFSFIVLILMG